MYRLNIVFVTDYFNIIFCSKRVHAVHRIGDLFQNFQEIKHLNPLASVCKQPDCRIATGYLLDGRELFPTGEKDISLYHNVHSASYTMGTREQGHEVGHSPPSSAEIKNGGAMPPSPNMSSCRDTLLSKHRNNFAPFYHIL
jgi:hypothetical protein